MKWGRIIRVVGACVVVCSLWTAAPAAASVPTFTKVFSVDTIGPGSTSRLTFTISNPDATGVTDLAFDDEFPAAVSFAEPAFVKNFCGGTLTLDLTDADPAFDVRLTDGVVGASQACTIVVNVTSATPGTHMNVSGDLTSSAGNSGTAADDLTVDTTLPGFSKSFAPTTVEFGGISTLTFLIDNTANASPVDNLDFIDVLPPGMVIADPENASTDCGTATIPPTLDAEPGSSVITLDANGTFGFPAIPAFSTCTVEVDVVGGAVGSLGNVSGDLQAEFVEAGKAAAVLEVTGIAGLLEVLKSFTDDPVAPGGTVTLRFTVTNKSRDFSAEDITFDDVIDPMGGLTGLTPTLPPTPDPPCGPLSSLTFASGTLTLEDGELAPEASCTFSVALSVPSTATPGSYANTTTAVEGTIDEATETGNVAGDILSVVAFPILTKKFTDDPVGAGGTATLEFTIFNTSSSAITDIAFLDELTDGGPNTGFLPFPVSVGLPPTPDPPCNGTSSLSLDFIDTDRQGLQLLGGELAASDGVPGGADTCSFTVTVDIPDGFPGGTYLNTTRRITAKIGATTVTGKRAKDSIVVLGAPRIFKEFTDDPALPGGMVTLEFTLEHDEFAGGAASAIAFTDDLSSIGLTIDSVVTDTCGGTPSGVGTDMFGYTGGSLATDATCTIELLLDVPDVAGGTFTNTTSELTATVLGVPVTSLAAEDDLVITGLQFSKLFTGEPVIAGGTATLTFTIDNTAGTSPDDDATDLFFTDNLDDALPGLVATLPPTPDPPCGPSSILFGFPTGDGGTSLTLFDGEVDGGDSCTFSVTVTVPTTIPAPPGPDIPTPDGEYVNATSSLTATIDGMGVSLPPAVDELEVNSTLIDISKEFTDDPVAPGGTATLVFTLENLSATEMVTDVEFEDDLGAVLSGLEATGFVDTCGGMSPTVFPDGFFEFADGTLLPDTSCTVTVTLSVPDAPLASSAPFINISTEVSGKVGGLDVGGGTATDELLVQLVAISKDFTDDPVAAGGSVTLEFTLTNAGADPVADLDFIDDLSAMGIPGLTATTLPAVGVCGPGSALTGTTFLTFTGGSLAGGASCTIPVTLTVPAMAAAGTFVNTTSELRAQGGPVAPGDTALLVIEPPPVFSKAFAPDAILIGGLSTLTFTIDNSASTLAATSLDFTDALPAGVEVAPTPGATTDCTGGTLTAMAGAGVISYTGGEVAAGAACTIEVDVVGIASGMLVNTTGDLTSSSGNSGAATDTLTVIVPEADLELVKSDLSDPVMAGEYQIYKLTVTNLGPGTAVSVILTDPLPAGTIFVQAGPPSAGCSHAAGVVTCALGSLASGASKTVSIQVFVDAAAISPIENVASVSTTSSDPVPANNEVMISTEVIPFERFVVLNDRNGNGFPEVALPILGADTKLRILDVDTNFNVVAPFLLFPSGFTLVALDKTPDLSGDGKQDVVAAARDDGDGSHVVGVFNASDGMVVSAFTLPPGLALTDLEVIDDDGFGDTLLAMSSHRFADGVNKIRLRKAKDATNLGTTVHPSDFFPIDVEAVPSFTGDLGVELATVGVRSSNFVKRVFVRELSGALVSNGSLPTSLRPIELEVAPDFAGAPDPELAVLAFDRLLGKPRVVTVDAGTGDTVGGSLGFPVGGAPSPNGLAIVPDFGGTMTPEVAVLFRNAAGRAAARVRDLGDDSELFRGGFGPAAGSIPFGVEVVPHFGGLPSPELAVLTEDPMTGKRVVTVRDASGGPVLRNVLIP